MCPIVLVGYSLISGCQCGEIISKAFKVCGPCLVSGFRVLYPDVSPEGLSLWHLRHCVFAEESSDLGFCGASL